MQAINNWSLLVCNVFKLLPIKSWDACCAYKALFEIPCKVKPWYFDSKLQNCIEKSGGTVRDTVDLIRGGHYHLMWLFKYVDFVPTLLVHFSDGMVSPSEGIHVKLLLVVLSALEQDGIFLILTFWSEIPHIVT